MFVYFAEPIDQNPQGNYVEQELRNLMVKQLQGLGATVFRPATGFRMLPEFVTAKTAQPMEEVNRFALDKADVIVARLPKGVASHGVPMEVEYATRQLGIPAIVVGEVGVAMLGNPMVTAIKPSDLEATFKEVAVERVEIVKPLFHSGYLRPKSYEGDAGIDLTTSVETLVEPNSWALVPTGNRIEVPRGMFAWITNRSSTIKNFGLMVIQGIIDEGYTGDYYASVWNLTEKPVTLLPGDRVAQVLFLPNLLKGLVPIEVDEIEQRDRGSNGFGSTG